MTDNAKTKYEKATALREANPTWSIKKCCERARISVPSFYETKRETEAQRTALTQTTTLTTAHAPMWKQIVKSNLPTSTKMEILNTL